MQRHHALAGHGRGTLGVGITDGQCQCQKKQVVGLHAVVVADPQPSAILTPCPGIGPLFSTIGTSRLARHDATLHFILVHFLSSLYSLNIFWLLKLWDGEKEEKKYI